MADDFGTPLEERIDDLIARCRGSGRFASRQEVEDLYTEGCAEALTIEARCLQAERRLGAATATDRGPTGPAQTRALKDELAELRARLDAVRVQVRHLRAAVDWAEEGHALEELLPKSSAPRAGHAD